MILVHNKLTTAALKSYVSRCACAYGLLLSYSNLLLLKWYYKVVSVSEYPSLGVWNCGGNLELGANLQIWRFFSIFCQKFISRGGSNFSQKLQSFVAILKGPFFGGCPPEFLFWSDILDKCFQSESIQSYWSVIGWLHFALNFTELSLVSKWVDSD